MLGSPSPLLGVHPLCWGSIPFVGGVHPLCWGDPSPLLGGSVPSAVFLLRVVRFGGGGAVTAADDLPPSSSSLRQRRPERKEARRHRCRLAEPDASLLRCRQLLRKRRCPGRGGRGGYSRLSPTLRVPHGGAGGGPGHSPLPPPPSPGEPQRVRKHSRTFCFQFFSRCPKLSGLGALELPFLPGGGGGVRLQPHPLHPQGANPPPPPLLIPPRGQKGSPKPGQDAPKGEGLTGTGGR